MIEANDKVVHHGSIYSPEFAEAVANRIPNKWDIGQSFTRTPNGTPVIDGVPIYTSQNIVVGMEYEVKYNLSEKAKNYDVSYKVRNREDGSVFVSDLQKLKSKENRL